MHKLRRMLLSPSVRTGFFVIGWVTLLFVLVLCPIGAGAQWVTGVGIIGVAFLVTANSLAIRASLWRSQANLTATKEFSRRETEDILSLIDVKADRLEKRVASVGSLNHRQSSTGNVRATTEAKTLSETRGPALEPKLIFPDMPYLANYLDAVGEAKRDPILVIGDFKLVNRDSVVERLRSVAHDLELKIETVSSTHREMPVWDVRSFKRIVILPHEAEPASLIPFSWIEPRARIHVLGAHIDDDYLRDLNYGTAVDFAHLPAGRLGVEVKVRRKQA